MFNTAGALGEMQFKKFLLSHKSTFRLLDLEEAVCQQEVVELCLKWQSNRVSSLLRKGKLTMQELLHKDISFLLDHLFKVDYLVEIEDLNGKSIWVAMDFTLDYRKLAVKEFEFRQLEPALRELGITKALVVNWKEPPMNKPLSYKMAGIIQETLDFLAEEDKFAGTAIL